MSDASYQETVREYFTDPTLEALRRLNVARRRCDLPRLVRLRLQLDPKLVVVMVVDGRLPEFSRVAVFWDLPEGVKEARSLDGSKLGWDNPHATDVECDVVIEPEAVGDVFRIVAIGDLAQYSTYSFALQDVEEQVTVQVGPIALERNYTAP